jgi:phage-related protein (TIGR01555 family)
VGKARLRSIKPAPPAPPARSDSLSNVLTGLGTDVDPRLATKVVYKNRQGWEQRDELYVTNHLIATIIDKPADEATSAWIELGGDGGDGETEAEDAANPGGLDDDWPKMVLDALEGLKAQEVFSDFLRRDLKDGGACCLMLVDDGQPLEKPINRGGVRGVRGLVLVDNRLVRPGPDVGDYASPHYGRPETYSITNYASGRVVEVHADRILASFGIVASDDTRRRRGGWGESMVDRVATPVLRFTELWDYIQTTIGKFSQTYLAIEGLTDLLASRGKEGEDLIRKRLQTFQKYRSTLRVAPIDAKDRIDEKAVSYQGVATILGQAMEEVAAAAQMPLTLLFGHAPGGLSTDDESGKANWRKRVGAIQERKLRDPLNRLIDLLLISSDGPTKGVVPDRWKLRFCSLEEPNEESESKTRNQDAQTDAILVTSNVISPAEARTRLLKDDECVYDLDPTALDDGLGDIPPEAMPTMVKAPAAPPSPGQSASPTAPAASGQPPPTEKVQDTLPNGAQVAAGVEIVKAVAAGDLPRDAGLGMLKVFYRFSDAEAAAIMGSVGAGFSAPKPTPPPPPAGGPPPQPTPPPKPGE